MVGCAGIAPAMALRAAVLPTAHDLYVTNNPSGLRDVESHHDQKAYEAPRVLNLPAIQWKWHGVPVLPRTRGVLETPLRKLTPAVWWMNGNRCLVL